MINHKKNVKLLERKSVVYNLPNLLTISRIAVIPLIFLSVYFECSFFNYIAGVLFIAASITDYYDGKLARDRGEVSAFGRLLDPIADKLLVATALVVILAKPGMIHEISYIPVFVILCRELLVSGLREFLREVNVGLPVTRLAKWKTGFQMTALAMIFFKGWWIWGETGEVLLWIAGILTFITGYQYFEKSLLYVKTEAGQKKAASQSVSAAEKKVSALKAENKSTPVRNTAAKSAPRRGRRRAQTTPGRLRDSRRRRRTSRRPVVRPAPFAAAQAVRLCRPVRPRPRFRCAIQIP